MEGGNNMNNNTAYRNTNQEPQAPDELLKVTALLYFKEALVKQEFEDCPSLIATAKRYGATQPEIWNVIAEYKGEGDTVRQIEADEQIGGRLRFLEEE